MPKYNVNDQVRHKVTMKKYTITRVLPNIHTQIFEYDLVGPKELLNAVPEHLLYADSGTTVPALPTAAYQIGDQFESYGIQFTICRIIRGGTFGVMYGVSTPVSNSTLLKEEHLNTSCVLIGGPTHISRIANGLGVTPPPGITLINPPKRETVSCECGAHAVRNSLHSRWCPDYREFK